MSASPRKLLRRAADALQQVEHIVARYPDARAELEATLGEGGLDALRRATAVVERALVRVEASRMTGGVGSATDPPGAPDTTER